MAETTNKDSCCIENVLDPLLRTLLILTLISKFRFFFSLFAIYRQQPGVTNYVLEAVHHPLTNDRNQALSGGGNREARGPSQAGDPRRRDPRVRVCWLQVIFNIFYD